MTNTTVTFDEWFNVMVNREKDLNGNICVCATGFLSEATSIVGLTISPLGVYEGKTFEVKTIMTHYLDLAKHKFSDPAKRIVLHGVVERRGGVSNAALDPPTLSGVVKNKPNRLTLDTWYIRYAEV